MTMPLTPGSAPIPVSVQEPVKVTSVDGTVPKLLTGPVVQSQSHDPSLAATTTFQEDLTTAGQRAINLIWETRQGNIAIAVILGTMVIDGLALALSISLARDLTGAQAMALGVVNSLATGVVSFYFSRTNHTQIGGVGNKPNEEYKGR